MNPNSSYSFRISRSYLMQFYGIKKMDRDFSKIRQGGSISAFSPKAQFCGETKSHKI